MKINVNQSSCVRFIVAGRYRCGSNFLAASINTHPNAMTLHEIFNVSVLSKYPAILNNPVMHMQRALYSSVTPGINATGFKLMYQQATPAEFRIDHWCPFKNSTIEESLKTINAYIDKNEKQYLHKLGIFWEMLRGDSSIRIIHLKRTNQLASLISFAIAMQENNWIGRPYKTKGLILDPLDCLQWFKHGRSLYKHYNLLFSNKPVLSIEYESLVADFSNHMQKIYSFLDLPESKSVLPFFKKQQTIPLSKLILNYHDLKTYFYGTEWSSYFEYE